MPAEDKKTFSAELADARRPIVIGTAGHVDHGKSSLVLALTGTDPDRLVEEKARSMTIDLGFARLDLPSGRAASVVDVPGHEHFIKNMLAGIGGIDLALLVVAADEGPMPQTLEHLAIIDLLGIDRGVVAVTKSDLTEREMTDYVIEEVAGMMEGTTLGSAPILPVSATASTGLAELVAAIDEVADSLSSRATPGPARLPIDRTFTMSGFGTVVTGTMLGAGVFAAGDELTLLPEGRRVRVRGLQSHGEQVRFVSAGMRAAINLTGVDVDSVQRGMVLTSGSGLRASHRLDARLKLLSDAPAALEQNGRVDLFTGSSQVQAQLSLLEGNEIEPGDAALVQFRLAEPVAVAPGDRYIVRQASPSRTIGGGVILDAQSVRHKRFDRRVLERLRGREAGNPVDLVLSALGSDIHSRNDLLTAVSMLTSRELAEDAIDQLMAMATIESIGSDPTATSALLATSLTLTALFERILRLVETFHLEHPLRVGMPVEELRRGSGIGAQGFDAILDRMTGDGGLVREGPIVRLPAFRIELDAARQAKAGNYLEALRAQPLEPPTPQQFDIDRELLEAMEATGAIVIVNDQIAFDRHTHDMLVAHTVSHLDREGEITLAQFRDLVGTTRKYAQAILEDFDRRRLTRRAGDVRYAGPAARPVGRIREGTNSD